MFEIRGTVQDYAWGNTQGIQQIVGIPVDGTPAAEYWLGAHPKAPSPTADSTLLEHVSAHPEHLGEEARHTYGDRLPFLLKILSARTALSIQAHPTLDQARAGYERENAEGISMNAPHRNYKDAWHKPEMMYALTPFDALCGFRSPHAIKATFERLDTASGNPLLTQVIETLDGPDPLQTTLSTILTEPGYGELADQLAELTYEPVGAHHPSLEGSAQDPVTTLKRVNTDFPTDPGALVALMLNMLTLNPGEAIALNAGILHAYLGGLGIEIMASSDNVLRGGLTSKHIDIDELKAVVTYEPTAPDRVNADEGQWFKGATDDFKLLPLTSADTMVELDGPAIALCVEGTYALTAETQDSATVNTGESVFIPATDGNLTVRGDGKLFIASV